MAAKVDPQDYFPAQVTSLSHGITVVQNVKRKLSPVQMEMFRNTPFGRLLDVDIMHSGQLIHQMLLREVDGSDDTEIHFSIEGTTATWSRYEFRIVTGLWPSKQRPPCGAGSNRLRDIYFNGSQQITCNELENTFKNMSTHSDEDVAKMGILYFLEHVLLGKERKSFVDMDNIFLVDDLNAFFLYDWGSEVYKRTLSSMKRALINRVDKYKEKVAKDPNHIQRYTISGYLIPFQVWIYEVVPKLGELCAIRVSPNAVPHILCWRSPRAPTAVEIENIFSSGELYFERPLVATSATKRAAALVGYKLDDAPVIEDPTDRGRVRRARENESVEATADLGAHVERENETHVDRHKRYPRRAIRRIEERLSVLESSFSAHRDEIARRMTSLESRFISLETNVISLETNVMTALQSLLEQQRNQGKEHQPEGTCGGVVVEEGVLQEDTYGEGAVEIGVEDKGGNGAVETVGEKVAMTCGEQCQTHPSSIQGEQRTTSLHHSNLNSFEADENPTCTSSLPSFTPSSIHLSLSWPLDGVLSLQWIQHLIIALDWSSKNLPPSHFPSVLPVSVFDSLILSASKILHKEPNCLRILDDPSTSTDATVVVVGDLHGQFHDLLFLLHDAGFPSENRFFVFNGDYVDRGAWGIETFVLLLAWKVFMPHRVFLLRGNHESKYCTSIYGFEKEVLIKYGDKGRHVYHKCLECFKGLSLASIIAGCVYTAHGGLFRSISVPPSKRSKGKKKRKIITNPEANTLSLGSLEELCKARRSVLDPPWEGMNLIPGDVLWSDPSMNPGLSPNEERGIGLLWGPDCTEDFLKKFNLKLIIRSHEGPDAREKRPGLAGMNQGYTLDHVVDSGKLITLFSAPDYPQFQATEERYNNKGAYIILEPPYFHEPIIHSFEAITPRPKVDPYYDFETVIDSNEELDLARMETSPSI